MRTCGAYVQEASPFFEIFTQVKKEICEQCSNVNRRLFDFCGAGVSVVIASLCLCCGV